MGPKSVRAHDAHQLGRVGVGDGAAPAGDAGVVDEDVDVAEVGEDLRRHGLVLLQGVDAGLVGHGPAAELLDVGDGLLGCLFVAAIVHGHVGAVGGEGEADGPTDATAAAGDERDTTVKTHWRPTL